MASGEVRYASSWQIVGSSVTTIGTKNEPLPTPPATKFWVVSTEVFLPGERAGDFARRAGGMGRCGRWCGSDTSTRSRDAPMGMGLGMVLDELKQCDGEAQGEP